MKRKFIRQAMKRAIGSNRIAASWKNFQIRRYGFIRWWNMRVTCDPAHRSASTLFYTKHFAADGAVSKSASAVVVHKKLRLSDKLRGLFRRNVPA